MANRRIVVLLLSVIAVICISVILLFALPDKSSDLKLYTNKVNTGVKYYNSGDYEVAIKNFEEAIELNPEELDAYENLGLAYLMLGNTDKARSTWETGYERTKNDRFKTLIREYLGVDDTSQTTTSTQTTTEPEATSSDTETTTSRTETTTESSQTQTTTSDTETTTTNESQTETTTTKAAQTTKKQTTAATTKATTKSTTTTTTKQTTKATTKQTPSVKIIGTSNFGANGGNVKATFYSDGSVIISGTGKMRECSYDQINGSDPGQETITLLWANYSNTDFGGLKRATISSGVTSIGRCAFMMASGLERITIPSTVTSIGYYAFVNCHSLTEVVIPASVTTIDEDAFGDCPNLTIKGKSGSTAQKYAQQNGIKFVAI